MDPASDTYDPQLDPFWITQNFAAGNPSAPPTPQDGMNTVHVSLIPSGVHRGEVLVLDGNLTNYGTRTHQPWSIVNPYWPLPNPNFWPGQTMPQYRFHNALLAMPPTEGELFCAGHCWLPDGRLLLAGGTKSYPGENGNGYWEGGRLLYQWDPVPTAGNPFGTWYRMANLEANRWYPTVRVDGSRDWRAIVIGGSDDAVSFEDQQVNSYEAVRFDFNRPIPPGLLPTPQDFDRKPVPTSPSWPSTVAQPAPSVRQYWGPNVPIAIPNTPWTSYQAFREYPRIHALGILDPISGGGSAPRLFMNAQPLWGMHWAHDETTDPTFGTNVATGVGYNIGQNPWNNDVSALYGVSILMPSPIGGQQTQVLRTGGSRWTSGPSQVVETVQTNIPSTASNSWSTSIPAMQYKRMHLNMVTLPTGEMMAIGGNDSATNFHFIPELLSSGGTTWTPLAPHPGPRDYHSAALLLPDGRVFVAGGEARKTTATPGPDYLIFEPPYFHLDYGSVPPTGITVNNVVTGALVQQDQIGFAGMQYATEYRATWTNQLEDGVTVASVVLITPSSVTHHDDGGQRFLRLVTYYDDDATQPPTNGIKFRSPASDLVAQPGWYMLFLVTSSGRPSQAYWVHLL